MQNIFSRVIIKDDSNNILVIKDREQLWNFPGGKIEPHETSAECAIREIQEEVGIIIDQLTKIYFDKFIFNDVEWEGHFYFADRVSGGLPTINEPQKISQLKFIYNKELVNFPKQFEKIVEEVFTNNLLSGKRTEWN